MTDAAGAVGPAARLLGYAGLLPQFAAVVLLATSGPLDHGRNVGLWIVIAYPLLILSFLGGTWWTLALRASSRQGALAGIAVLPTLVAFALATVVVVTSATAVSTVAWELVSLGSVIALTLLVDRHFETIGVAPRGWMTLRTPLSLGLGTLTIGAAVLLAR